MTVKIESLAAANDELRAQSHAYKKSADEKDVELKQVFI